MLTEISILLSWRVGSSVKRRGMSRTPSILRNLGKREPICSLVLAKMLE